MVQLRQLGPSALQIVGGMLLHQLSSDVWVVGLFLLEGCTVVADTMQFQPKGAWLSQPQGLERVDRQVPAKVTVKFPIGGEPGSPIAR